MKDTKFSMKKKLFASTSMLVVSAMMLSTATYAWFTMSKEVTVTGMELKAQATDGIVISGDNKGTWKQDWDVSMTSGVALYPTSTDGAVTPAWAVAYSKEFDDAWKNQSGTGYTNLTMTYTTSGTSGDTFTSGLDGIGQAESPSRNYVLLKQFYIKSTGESDWAQRLVIDEVTAEVADTTGSGSGDLNKALRVLVVVKNSSGSQTSSFIYAPIANYDTAINYKGTTPLTLVASTDDSSTAITSIPNTNDAAISVQMYMYYEGEDQNCKSSNITAISVDTLKVSAKFKTVDLNP